MGGPQSPHGSGVTVLSSLIGGDSKLEKVKHDIALSPYYEYYLYLTKK